MHKLLSTLIILLIGQTLSAQSVLKGSVQDEKKQAFENVTVVLLRGDSLLAGTITDKQGNFLFEEIEQGIYKLSISFLGFKEITEQIQVDKRNMRLPIFILKEDALALSEVTVSAHRQDLVSYNANSTEFRLSEKALKESADAFFALGEIPKLIVDPTEKTIKLSDGSTPLILINGVNRPGYINTLDPSDIISVELIENSSARYRGEEGVRSIINLKVRRKKQAYASARFAVQQDVLGRCNSTRAALETGNNKASVFLDFDFWLFNEGGETNLYQRNEDYTLRSLTEFDQKVPRPKLTLGGDWEISDRNYISYGIFGSYEMIRYDYLGNGQATLGDLSSLVEIDQKLKTTNWTNSYQLYYRHRFTENNILELTGSYGFYDNDSRGKEDLVSDINGYQTLIDLKNRKHAASFEANQSIGSFDKWAFNVGSNSYFQQININDQSGDNPKFRYKEGREYLYADISGKGKGKFGYMLSVGLDMVFTNAGSTKNHYINFLPQVSLSYTLAKDQILRLYASRNRQSPSVAQLNPYNTSTDSLSLSTGNPYLHPTIDNQFDLRYELSYKSLYINPYVTYHYYTDLIESTGEERNGIYYSSYENADNHHQLQTGINTRIRLGSWGSIGGGVFYTKDFYEKGYPFSGESVGGMGNVRLQYKKLTLSAYAYYGGFSYTKTDKVRYKSESQAYLYWTVTPKITLSIGVRYYVPSFEDRYWTRAANHEFYMVQKRDHFMPMIGFSYVFKGQKNNRQRKDLQERNDGVDIRVQ